jgi:alkylhydroperoxidase family enzyme
MRFSVRHGWLAALAAAWAGLAPAAEDPRPAPQARVPLIDNAEAWARLPVVRDAEAPPPPLPHWALALASSLPRTTAAMLDLDHAHRARSPIDPALRARMRWVAAEANRSPYALATAEADLRRTGADDAAIAALRAGDDSALTEIERAALDFARTMTRDAAAVTDDEVARLMDAYGPPQVVAMVQLLAYANFQDRLLLALGIPIEPDGPLPPLAVRLDREARPEVPPRVKPEGANPPPAPERVDDPEWAALDFGATRRQLDDQRDRPGRIRVPTFDEVMSRLPPGARRPPRPVRIQWSLVCMGYQPELALAWSACTNLFAEEARQDRVFEESLFWVVTRTIHCFY